MGCNDSIVNVPLRMHGDIIILLYYDLVAFVVLGYTDYIFSSDGGITIDIHLCIFNNSNITGHRFS